jgi:hypothetical protein
MSPIADKQFIGAIANDGPVLTGTFAAIFALLGHIPVNKDWTSFEIIQSVMHALSAALVYIAAKRATKMEAAAVFAGLVWATYPAAVIASGRFYNEPLMLLLALASLVFASQRPATIVSTAGGSYFSGLVFLMKPALFAGAALSYLCMLLGAKSKPRALALIAVGVILAFGPWALYTKTFLGKVYFTTPRNSGYNFAMGNDTEVGGVLTSPMPPLTSLHLNETQPTTILYAELANNTSEYLTMVLRKVTRMYANPWNDFRHTYFGLDSEAQQVWHLFLLFGGAFGVAIFVLETLAQNKINYNQNSVQILALGWLASPIVYLLFEANSRYGFSITPFLAVFCAVPFARFQAMKSKMSIIWVASGAVAAVFTLLVANLDALTHLGQSKELAFRLAPHEVACKTLTLTSDHKPNFKVPDTRVFIMVDGDERLSQARLSLNGHEIKGALKHLRYFYPSKYSEYYVFQELGYSSDQLPENYRQWRIVEIPQNLVNWSGDNKIEIRAPDQGLLVYGESDGQTRHYLSPLYYSPIKIADASKSMETRLIMPEIKAKIAQVSTRDDGAGHQATLPGALRVHLVTADPFVPQGSEPLPSVAASWPSRGKHFDITIKNFDPCFATGNPDELHTSRHVVDEAGSVCAVFALPRTVGSNAVKLKLTGLIKAAKPGSKVGFDK